jgi:solute carrier family 25 oxoglutarate transporter 11
LAAGAIGSVIGNPCDLALVRMQADSTLPKAERRNYSNVFDALGRIVKDEGVLSLWKGSIPTVCRAMSLNCAMLVSYDTVKEKAIAKLGKDAYYQVAFYSAMTAAVCTALASLPFDNMKTKIQKQKADANGVLPYKNIVDCCKKTVAREGVTGLWAGLPTYYFRVGPHAIITLLVADALKLRMMKN